jgi:hypothetical protein
MGLKWSLFANVTLAWLIKGRFDSTPNLVDTKIFIETGCGYFAEQILFWIPLYPLFASPDAAVIEEPDNFKHQEYIRPLPSFPPHHSHTQFLSSL